MRSLGIRPFFSLILAACLAVALWPAACTSALSNGAQVDAPNSPGELRAASNTTFLPHPAFAYADSGSKAVSISDIAEKATPSVVNISSSRVVAHRDHPFLSDPFFRHFFGPRMPERDRKEKGLGSGVIVSKEGVVLTNNHVVEKADSIQVTTADGREFEAEVVGTDDKSDLAVIKLKGDTKGLTPIEFADSSRARLGDVVLAIGNPFGVGQTVTMGIVSAKGRADVGIVDYEDFIQTDAAINPGNSGGALVNMEGKLLGINTAILSRSGGYMGIGFAIPSNMARPIADSLLKNGKVVRGWLGVGIQDLNPELAKALKVGDTDGVLLSDVEKGGPADKAGLRRGDIVTKVNGTQVDSTGRLRNLVAGSGAGSKVSVEFLREGKTKKVNVTLGELPSDKQVSLKPSGKSDVLAGLTLENLNADLRRKFKIAPAVKDGVVVVDIERGSPASAAGLQPGDVIVELNRKAVGDVASFRRIYKTVKDQALLLVSRQGHTIFIVLKR